MGTVVPKWAHDITRAHRAACLMRLPRRPGGIAGDVRWVEGLDLARALDDQWGRLRSAASRPSRSVYCQLCSGLAQPKRPSLC